MKSYEINNYYHVTKRKNLDSILEKGLLPLVGQNSENVNDLREGEPPKLCFSEGYEGVILMANNFFMRYAYTDEGLTTEQIGLKNYETIMSNYDIMLTFDGEEIENENMPDIADGYTSKEGISPSNLNVVRLKSKDGKYIYDRETITIYMMSKVPIEKIIESDNKFISFLMKTKPLQYLQNELGERSYKTFLEEFYKYENEKSKINILENEYDIEYVYLTNELIEEIAKRKVQVQEGKLGIKDAMGGGITSSEVIKVTSDLNNTIRSQENELNQKNI